MAANGKISALINQAHKKMDKDYFTDFEIDIIFRKLLKELPYHIEFNFYIAPECNRIIMRRATKEMYIYELERRKICLHLQLKSSGGGKGSIFIY